MMNNVNNAKLQQHEGRRRMQQHLPQQQQHQVLQQQQHQGWSQEGRKFSPKSQELPAMMSGHHDVEKNTPTAAAKLRSGSEPGPWFFGLSPRAFESMVGPILQRSQKVFAENSFKMKNAVDGLFATEVELRDYKAELRANQIDIAQCLGRLYSDLNVVTDPNQEGDADNQPK